MKSIIPEDRATTKWREKAKKSGKIQPELPRANHDSSLKYIADILVKEERVKKSSTCAIL